MSAAVVASAQDSTSVPQSTQRHITPVLPNTNTVNRPDKHTDYRLVEKYISGDTVSIAEDERKDSIKRAYPRYPRLTELSIGLNFIDPVLMAFGQKYGGVDVSATLNMWNRIQPVIELGLGRAKSTPDDLNFTYRGKISPYAKIGFNYNFLFKSNPEYQALVGLRVAYSTFKYDITDISYDNTYWNEHTKFEILGEKSHALWAEFVAGLKVKIWHQISLGWMVKYHGIFNYKKNENSVPWYIPGYGPRKGSLGLGMSVFYTIPLSKDKWPKITTDKDNTTGNGAPSKPVEIKSTEQPAAPAEKK